MGESSMDKCIAIGIYMNGCGPDIEAVPVQASLGASSSYLHEHNYDAIIYGIENLKLVFVVINH